MHIYLVRHPPPIDTDGLCYGRLDVAVTPQAIVDAADAVLAQIPRETLEERARLLQPLLAMPRTGPAHRVAPRTHAGRGSHGNELRAVARSRHGMPCRESRSMPGRRTCGAIGPAAANRPKWSRTAGSAGWINCANRCTAASVVAVTHAGVIRVALARSGQLHDDAALTAPVPFGSVHRLDFPPHRERFRGNVPERVEHMGVTHG